MNDFVDFCRSHGLRVDYVEPDGLVHRVRTDAKPKHANGAYLWDGKSGWCQDWTIHVRAIPFCQESHHEPFILPRQPNPKQLARQKSLEHDAAAVHAKLILERCSYGPHLYLARKGFPEVNAFIDIDGRMVVPMRSAQQYANIVSVQHIDGDGGKRFLPGGAAKEAVYHVGRGGVTWLVEGYATALSVRMACEALYQQDKVVVCFSAGTLSRVARFYPAAVVIADHDASAAGEKAAIATGLKWAMPIDVGMDANDLMLRDGVDAVCDLLRRAESG